MSQTPLLIDVQIVLTNDEYEAIVHIASNQDWDLSQAVSAIIRGWALDYRLTLMGQS